MDGVATLAFRRSPRTWDALALTVVLLSLGSIAGCTPTGDANSPRPSGTVSRAPARVSEGIASRPPTAGDVSGPPASGSIRIQAIDQPGLFDGPDTIILRDIVTAGAGFTVLGDVGRGITPRIDAWLSPDGQTWERDATVTGLDGVTVNDVEETASGRLVAVGWKQAAALTWSSDDGGRTWQEHVLPGDPHGQAYAATSGSAGTLMLVGGPIGRGPEQATKLWFSPDGASWSAVAMPDDVFGAIEIRGITATTNGFVAVGGRAPANPIRPGDQTEYRAAAWLSVDGRTWSAATVSDRPMMLGAVAGSEGLIGFGWGEPITRPQTWFSEIGASWIANPLVSDKSPAVVAHDGLMSWLDSTVIRSGLAKLEWKTSRNGIDWVSLGSVEESRAVGIGGFRAGDPGILQLGGSIDRPAMWLFSIPG
ncbi:MAG TPA: hypothetical protein VHM48_14955 [Candidatus Limnocylindrales bacterium]|nr:hypothetical protein [Candidatus Limnocylindrales bacterium]